MSTPTTPPTPPRRVARRRGPRRPATPRVPTSDTPAGRQRPRPPDQAPHRAGAAPAAAAPSPRRPGPPAAATVRAGRPGRRPAGTRRAGTWLAGPAPFAIVLGLLGLVVARRAPRRAHRPDHPLGRPRPVDRRRGRPRRRCSSGPSACAQPTHSGLRPPWSSCASPTARRATCTLATTGDRASSARGTQRASDVDPPTSWTTGRVGRRTGRCAAAAPRGSPRPLVATGRPSAGS